MLSQKILSSAIASQQLFISLQSLTQCSFANAKKKKAKKQAKPKPKIEMPPENPYTDIPNNKMRQIISEKLAQSKFDVPHFYIGKIINMDALLAGRKKLLAEKGVKVSINDIIVKAAGLALADMKVVNSYWMKDKIREFQNADVSFAVDIPGGLITPIVHQTDKLSMIDCSKKIKELIKKAKDGKLQPHEFMGGTLTVTNLGMFGVDAMIGVINPPQGALLAIAKSSQVAVPDPKDKTKLKTVTQMWAYLCCDHRIIDGARGAQWMQKFAEHMEKPEKFLFN